MIHHGLVLIGIYFVVTGISHLSSLSTAMYAYDSEMKAFVVPENWWVLALVIPVSLGLLWVLPGALLIKFARPISERFAAREAAESSGLSDSGLYVVLLLALAAFFFVTGVGQILVGLAQIVPELLDWSELSMIRFGIGSLLDGIVRVLAAIFLYYHSLGAARPAA